MEDMARLALIEQSVRDLDKFSQILYELLRHINHILENPHDFKLRTIKSDILKNVIKDDALSEYIKYVGFQSVGNQFVYPKNMTLSNLRMAQVAIERKIGFCYGSLDKSKASTVSSQPEGSEKKMSLSPVHILTKNPLLLKIESLFNNILVYEDEELQSLAREQIPIVTLQLMALDRVREQQRQLKTGEIKGNDLPFDIALLMELLSWFKYKFFSWVDKPECELCGGPTTFTNNISMTTDRETCRLELYKCTVCKEGRSRFPRYNDVRTLLRTRRGRCGEWANCFALLCRALGYDTRYVYDTTDHVWCEVFDFDSNTWLHADPCEAVLNAPLLYTHGWKKQLSYVIAVSRDDLQDVTWRYTMNHKEVLKNRRVCEESELVGYVVGLRALRQRQVSEPRRAYLARRTAQELVQLMVERQPSDYESHGRISGSKQWRMERGEIGTDTKSHTFEFNETGTYTIQYYTGPDKYRIYCGETELEPVKSWAAGVYETKNIFRKVESDWKQVYLAREEGEASGAISWRLSTKGDLRFACMDVRLNSAIYENGRIDWTVTFDGEKPVNAKLGEKPTQFKREFRAVVISAELSGGSGDVGWQHAQLFRQPIDSKACAFEVLATLAEQ